MSKINAFRLVNIKFGSNNFIEDETFYLNSKDTLIQLQNGGGKSVMVQMLLAPHVHPKKRNIISSGQTRLFSSYFQTAEPSFILVEYKLDDGGGYVLTGMMLRKGMQNDDEVNNLEIIGIIAEYNTACEYDIHHLPIVGKDSFKNWNECYKTLEQFEKKHRSFTTYTLGNYSVYSRYFAQLRENGVDYQIWENILRKINSEEAGLSKIFSECTTERKLMENWILDQIDKKLNSKEVLINGIRNNANEYVKQYSMKESDIILKETLSRLHIYIMQNIQPRVKNIITIEGEVNNSCCAFNSALQRVSELASQVHEHSIKLEKDKCDIEEKIQLTKYAQLSSEYHEIKSESEILEGRLNTLREQIELLKKGIKENERIQNIHTCMVMQNELNELKRMQIEYETTLKNAMKENEQILSELLPVGGQLLTWTYQERNRNDLLIEQFNNEINGHQNSLVQLERLSDDYDKLINDLEKNIITLNERIRRYEEEDERQYIRKYGAPFENSLLSTSHNYPVEALENKLAERIERQDAIKKEILEKENTKEINERNIKDKSATEKAERNNLEVLTANLEKTKNSKAAMDTDIETRKKIIKDFEMPVNDFYDKDAIINNLEIKIADIDAKINTSNRQLYILLDKKEKYIKGFVNLSKEFDVFLEENNVKAKKTLEWLRTETGTSLEDKTELLRRNPLLPYSMIIEQEDIIKIQNAKDRPETFSIIPFFTRKGVFADLYSMNGDNSFLYANTNTALLDESSFNKLVNEINRDINKTEDSIRSYDDARNVCIRHKISIENSTLAKNDYTKICQDLQNAEIEISEKKHYIDILVNNIQSLQEENIDINKFLKDSREFLMEITANCEALENLIAKYKEYISNKNENEENKNQKDKYILEKKTIKLNYDAYESQIKHIEENRERVKKENEKLDNIREDVLKYCEKETPIDDLFNYIETRGLYDGLVKKLNNDNKSVQVTQEKLDSVNRDIKYKDEILTFNMQNYCLSAGDLYEISLEEARRCNERNADLNKQKDMLCNEFDSDDRNLAAKNELAKEKIKEIRIKQHDDAMSREDLAFHGFINCNFAEKIAALSLEQKEFEKNISSSNLLKGRLESILEVNTKIECEETYIKNIELPDYFKFSSIDAKAISKYIGDINNEIVNMNKSINVKKDELKSYIDKIKDIPNSKLIEEREIQWFYNSKDNVHRLDDHLDRRCESIRLKITKIEEDLTNINEKKNTIVSLIGSYLDRIFYEIGKINDGASIKIQDKSKRTMKITIPSLADNKKLYEARIIGLLDELVITCKSIKDDENAMTDTIDKAFTTCSIFDKIVGIDNTRIDVLKVEANKVTLVPWNNISLSGGENFLVALFILSSLLSYMDCNHEGMATARKKGKVLLMDNPFAFVNAEHLLKPMIEIAEKNGIQLICFTGHEGKAIYDSFTNFYVVQKITNQENGNNYLHAEDQHGESTVILPIHMSIEQHSLFSNA